MRLVFTPDWFLNQDIIIEIFSFTILTSFFYLCIRSYKLGKNKNFLFLGGSFFLIALAELATIFAKVGLYYDTSLIQNIGQVIITYNFVESIDIFYYIGFFIHKLFTLIGFYILYRVLREGRIGSDILLVLYFIIISITFNNLSYYLFHGTALIILSFLIFNYCLVYKKHKSSNTLLLIFAFLGLALSQIILIFAKIGILYATAQLLQLVSYISLVVLIIRILKHGKKKNKDRYNSRNARSNSREGWGD